ncbi:MAG: exodeoxyribonuclease VII large subunit [Anaerolineae bacterium]|nr:exodeoxyribonuclease VII large subunit [Anaerolineae bacterium]
MWNQLELFAGPESPYSVSEVTARIRALLERESYLQNLWVAGEVSNFSRASSGHLYFTLKDSGAQLGCVVWRTQVQGLGYAPRSGDRVVVHGRIGLYEAGGRYQLYVDVVQPAGLGTLYQEYERLKAKLEAEGLFAAGRKRPLPQFPRRIGVATSPTAAALRDVLNVLRRRFPLVDVLLSPTLVQGDAAPSRIVRALAALNARDDVDVILLVRGGGSLEDLWAFNDERVARAVAASRLPVISGVGHETDFSLADFAADLRAPTPSAAAELATPDQERLREQVHQLRARLERAGDLRLSDARQRWAQLERALAYVSPQARLSNARQRVDDLNARAEASLAHCLAAAVQRLQSATARLAALNPEAVLRRGYAIVRDRETGGIVGSVVETRPGQLLRIQFRDGSIPARVEPEAQ